MAGRVTLIGLLIVCIVAGCGGGTSSPSTAPGGPTVLSPTGVASPSFEELNAQLQAEFARLGIDPAKVSAAAPSGDKNAVFDLVAEVIDPDGEGPLDPTGIELTWTERLIGDYNQDGMVTANDLSPLGQNYAMDTSEPQIDYDDPAVHEGLEYWPSGDPAGAGAHNWFLSRIDGNNDGFILMHDITPIAQHWEEKLSGYRLYRKAPGETGFTWIIDPADDEQRYTIARPVANAGVPVRYSFTDSPAVPGVYEYYVIGFAEEVASSSQEGEAPSNTVTTTLNLTGIDLYPPEWDTTVGVASATANLDGTITVEWSAATDNAHPPAVATPPVSYTLYYSTETPINFETAYAVENAVSPWTSVPLVNGMEYYFAVRAQDGADPLNVESNTVELSAIVSGGITDTEPPVWTEPGPDIGPVEGIHSIEVCDGKLIITCADAVDALSPPVHYDLYYIPGPVGDTVMDGNGTKVRDDATLILDIPKVYEFEWKNRDLVHFLVRTRDSTAPANHDLNKQEVFKQAENVIRISVDPDVPGVDPTDIRRIDTGREMDYANRKCYKVYSQEYSDHKNKEVWFLETDMETGAWEAKLIHIVSPATDGKDLLGLPIKLSPSGDLWTFIDDSSQMFYRRPPGGEWSEWVKWEPQNGHIFSRWSENFGHDEMPAMFTAIESEVIANRMALYYNWYDDQSEQWITELASDPGTCNAHSHLRPDGVLQVVSSEDIRQIGDTSPAYGRVLERTPDGTWTEVLSGVGRLYDENTNRNYQDMWDSQWAWGAFSTIRGTDEVLVYGLKGGYEFLPAGMFGDYPVDDDGKVWPADGGYHALPRYLLQDGEYHEQWFWGTHYLGTKWIPEEDLGKIANAFGQFYFNPVDGYYASVSPCFNLETEEVEAQLILPGPGSDLFTP